MPHRSFLLLPLLAVVALPLAGCVMPRWRRCPPRCTVVRRIPSPTVTPKPAPREYALYDGRTGRPISLESFLRQAQDADVVFFGELHDDLVGARFQKQILERLGSQPRPMALAMEFFERDQQADLDAYLAGRIDLDTMKERTHRSKTYDRTHGPLVEWAKAHQVPVLAANAPRRLVSAYRKFEGDYDAYVASLEEEQRPWLPAATSTPKDAYWERFSELMGGGEQAEGFFRSQALWDDAMAESLAAWRDTHPDGRVMLIVGGFHVDSGLGTVTKFTQRRPGDRTVLLVMTADDDPRLAFDREQDLGTGDAVLKVQPPKREPRGPNPHEKAPASPHEKDPPEASPTTEPPAPEA